MKQQTKRTELLYLEEHLSCGKYLKEVNTGFIYQEFEKGYSRKLEQEASMNYLIIVLEGRIRICCNLWRDKDIGQGEIFMVAKSSLLQGECLEDTRILTLAFENPITSCDKLNFRYLVELTDEIDYNLDTVPVKYPVSRFCELMVIYLAQKANCEHLHEIKHNEIFFCLRYFYTKHELTRLFYPILSHSLEFQHFVLENYKNVKSAKELVEVSHMGKSAFYKKFSSVFGVSAKQWLTTKRLHRIVNSAAQPDITVKSLMIEFEFETLSQFQAYCKRYFGCTPTMLISNAIKGNVKIKND